MTNESEILEVTISRITFQNGTGFVILGIVDHQGNKLSALGNMINPQVNMNYILTGEYQDNSTYGQQFKFSSYETVMPVDTNGIFKYITRICKFVGASTGNAIIDKYGKDTLSVMKNNPQKLALQINGITIHRAKEIQAILWENEKTEAIMIELETLLDVPGMRKNLPGELIKAYKSDAAEMVKDNPYILTYFRGISFFLADLVALNIGFKRDSIYRKKAATGHVMVENMRDGNIWIYKDELHIKVNELIQVPKLAAGIESLIYDDGACVEKEKHYAMAAPAKDEELIADIVVKMINGVN